MRLPEAAIVLLGLSAFGMAVKVHPDQAPGIYIGDPHDEHGLNHTRIGDIGAVSRILRGLKISNLEGGGASTSDEDPTRVIEKRSTTTPFESFGEHFHCVST